MVRLLCVLCCVYCGSVSLMSPLSAAPLPVPETPVQPVTDTLHGVEITDPYRWLEDGRSPATRAWINAQNTHTDDWLQQGDLHTNLRDQAEQLLRRNSKSVPIVRGQQLIYTRRLADESLPVICRQQGFDAAQDSIEILLDPLTEKQDGSVTYILDHVSADGKLLTYSVRTGGEDEVVVRFFDLQTRQHLPVELPRGRYFGVELTSDHQTLYYTLHGTEGSRVFKRAFTKDAQPEQIFGDGFEPGVGLSTSLSSTGRWLLIHAWYGSSGDKTEIYFQDLEQQSPIKPLVKDIVARFEGEAAENWCFILTNEGAPRGKLVRVDLLHPEREHWKVLVDETSGVLESFTLANKSIWLQRWRHDGGRLDFFKNPERGFRSRENAESEIFGVNSEGGSKTVWESQTGQVCTGLSGRWDSPYLFRTNSSLLHPDQILYFQNRKNEWSSHIAPAPSGRDDKAINIPHLWSKTEQSGLNEDYVVRQHFLESKDGTLIPIYLAHHKSITLNGNNPVLMTGYGGFNITLKPTYNPRAAMWCQMGGVFALVNLRGGGEFGEDWHKAGMREKKQNVFDDLHAAAEWLISSGYTRPDKLAISGRSNGGLLVGAGLTQRPDLYRAVICGYPLLDMVRYHKFLVARFWIPEYGSADDPAQFPYLRAYSPYHNVKPGTQYPATLFITGDADTRVDPLHARKMAALLQASATPERPILLRYETELGHTGARPVKKVAEDLADEFTFLVRELGVTLPQSTNDQTTDQFFDKQWEWTLREYPTFASHLGDKRYNARWPNLSPDALFLREEHLQEQSRHAQHLLAQWPSKSSRLNLQLYRKQVEWDREELRLKLHLIPLNQREGIQDESTVADSIAFETEQDYADWVTRLETFPTYLYQTMALMRRGIREGRIHPKVILERIPAQIKRQIVSDPTQSLYYKPLLQLPDSIPEASRTRLQTAAQVAIQEGIVPAYRDFLRFFETEYLPAGLPEVGVWQLPQGEEIYQFRIRQFTTTEMTADEIHTVGLGEVKRIRGEMEQVIKQVKFAGSFDEFLAHLRTDPQFYCATEQELFSAYQAVCKQIDPQLPKFFTKLPRTPYDLQAIPAHMAPDTTTAYYRPPSADGTRPGTYFVNLYKPAVRPKYEMAALSLHEAVPGHHLQIALASEMSGVPEFRKHASFTAYIEGWALYAESLGGEMGLYEDPYAKFGQLTYEMWRAVRLVVDTGIHSKRWTRQQAIDFFLKNTAKSEHDIINEVDRYIAWPGQALAYKIGELKITALRQEAQLALGERFDIRTFHDTILELGAVPLDVLEEHVRAWIVRQSVGR